MSSNNKTPDQESPETAIAVAEPSAPDAGETNAASPRESAEGNRYLVLTPLRSLST